MEHVHPSSEFAASRCRRFAQLFAAAWYLFLVAVLVATVRIPRIMPDEIGTWAIALFVGSGEAKVQMLSSPPYPVGPGLVLAPLSFIDDPALAYRLFVVLAKALCVIGAVLIAHTLTRAWKGPRSQRWIIVAVGAFYPAIFFGSSFSWAEFAIPLYWAVLVWASLRGLWGGRTGLLLASLAAGVGPLIHGRMSGIVIVWIVVNIWLSVRSDAQSSLRRQDRLIAIAVAALTWAASRSLDIYVVEQVWSSPAGDPAPISGVFDPYFYWSVVLTAVGQLWYATVSSAGLALVGAWWLLRSWRSTRSAMHRMSLATLSLMMLSNLAVSVAFIAGGMTRSHYTGVRPDHLYYGRYIDGMVWVLALIGVFAILGLSKIRLVRSIGFKVGIIMIALGVATAIVARYFFSSGRLVDFFGSVVPGVWVIPIPDSGPQIGWWTFAGLLAGGAIVLAAYSRKLLPVVLILIAAFGAGSAVLRVRAVHAKWGYESIFEDMPHPSDHNIVVVAQDAGTAPGYQLIRYGHQQQLASDGWRFEFVETNSQDLIDEPPDNAGAIVVVSWAWFDSDLVVGDVGPVVVLITDG
jgi:hypothetical protein